MAARELAVCILHYDVQIYDDLCANVLYKTQPTLPTTTKINTTPRTTVPSQTLKDGEVEDPIALEDFPENARRVTVGRNSTNDASQRMTKAESCKLKMLSVLN